MSIALGIHTLAVIAWVGLDSQAPGEFGNSGVEVALQLVGELVESEPIIVDDEPMSEEIKDTEIDLAPLEPEVDMTMPEPELLFEPVEPIAVENPQPVFDMELSFTDSSAERQEQNAGGQGAPTIQSTTGTGSTDQTGTAKRLSKSYVARLAAHLNRFKKYPKTSRRAKEEGRVEIALTVHADGSVDGIQLTNSSGFEELDAEALRMVDRAEPFPQIPASLRKRGIDEMNFRTSINFTLKD